MVYFIENDKQKFVINAVVFRFGADIRHDEDLPAAQLRLIQQCEAVDLLNPEKMQVFTPNDLPDETPNEHRTQTKDEEE